MVPGHQRVVAGGGDLRQHGVGAAAAAAGQPRHQRGHRHRGAGGAVELQVTHTFKPSFKLLLIFEGRKPFILKNVFNV